jgi:cysteinyl-tRNA synthetase
LSSYSSSSNTIDTTNNPLLQERIKVYNSFTKTKEPFVPLHPNHVSFYSCGPTVYDYAHIGNFRAFLTYDILKRWLIYCGYQVHHVCNITDVDDKIILKMNVEGLSLQQVTSKYTEAFYTDLKILNILPATQYPRATDYIDAMIHLIETLISRGYAYNEGGSVYFRIDSFPGYGSMINYDMHTLMDLAGTTGPQERVSGEDKRNSRDFALWKAFKPSDGEVVWDSPFGRGRPGWHIECSGHLISSYYL